MSILVHQRCVPAEAISRRLDPRLDKPGALWRVLDHSTVVDSIPAGFSVEATSLDAGPDTVM